MFKDIREFYKNESKLTLAIYLFLRFLIIVCMVLEIIRGNWNNVFLCVLTLVLYLIPYLIDRKLNIDLPSTLDIIILLFIFSAEILGEIQNFYGIIPYWDTILHTINGFLCAAIGLSLIDILHRSKNIGINLSPIFVSIVAFCFSMTIGVLWEFFEYGFDKTLNLDMQKDSIVSSISSVSLNQDGKNIPVTISNINETQIYSTDKNNNLIKTTIPNGYLDIGLNDTMNDLLVNFIGAFVFSVLGFFYIKNRDKYSFLNNFIPKAKEKS